MAKPHGQLRSTVPSRDDLVGQVAVVVDLRVDQLRQTEVCDLDARISVNHDVAGLEVAVENSARVHEFGSLKNLVENVFDVDLVAWVGVLNLSDCLKQVCILHRCNDIHVLEIFFLVELSIQVLNWQNLIKLGF